MLSIQNHDYVFLDKEPKEKETKSVYTSFHMIDEAIDGWIQKVLD